MAGWVYVITNKSMPRLVKIGFTENTPAQRAKDLNHTGNPHPYIVEYEVLVDEPRKIERSAHNKLASINAGKEWFRCTPEKAIAVIQEITTAVKISDKNSRADRIKAKEVAEERKFLRKISPHYEQAKDKRADKIRNSIETKEKEIREKYDIYLKQKFKEQPLWPYWVACLMAAIFIFDWLNIKESSVAIVMLLLIVTSVAYMIREFFGELKRESPEYRSTVSKMNDEISAVRNTPECKRCENIRLFYDFAYEKNGFLVCPRCGLMVLLPD